MEWELPPILKGGWGRGGIIQDTKGLWSMKVLGYGGCIYGILT